MADAKPSDPSPAASSAPGLPPRPVERIARPLARFLHIEAASGIVLAAATALALCAANSPLSDAYARFWETILAVRIGTFELAYPLWYWINDGAMTIFFFVIGLEIKRELVWGELRERRKVILPVAAALGGVVAPVAIYAAAQHGSPALAGWAVPMATDIAFVVGCLALLGTRVPGGLKVLVLTLAIVDDILAVLVIAVFYSHGLDLAWLGAAVLGFGVIVLLNRIGVRAVSAYFGVGAAIWLATLKSGIHPTVAGVLLGLSTPASAWIGKTTLVDVLDFTRGRLATETGSVDEPGGRKALGRLATASRESISPLERLEGALHAWVSFGIVPLFALANAGVPVTLESMLDPVAVSVALGLAAGKPLGITLACWLVVRAGWAPLPERVSWTALAGAGMLGGIGFTMALFIASLGLEGKLLGAAKAGILAGSFASAVLGMAVLAAALPRGGPRGVEQAPAGE